MRKITFSFGLLLLFFMNTLVAQTEIDTTKTTEIKEIIISAQFAPTNEKNTIYKVKTIHSKTIKAKASSNLTELLHHELNIDLSFHSALGAGIELNGVSKENIKILVDGIPLIGRVNGILNLNQINLENIDHIEVIEGPVSVFYGTNAMGGTINIITKKDQIEAVEGNLTSYYEDIDSKRISGNLDFKLGKNILKFAAGYSYFNGLNTDASLVRTLNWPKKRQYNKNLKYIRQIGKFKLRFSSDFSEELIHTLGKIRRNKATDIDYTTKRFDNSLNFQGKLNNGNFLNLTASYLDYKRFDTSYKFIPSEGSSTLIENNPFANANYFTTYFTKGQYANSKSTNKLKYVVGFEYQGDIGKGNRILNEKQKIDNTSLFGSINYKVQDQLEIQPAIRFTNNSSFGNLWSPAFNLKYRFNQNNTLRIAYAIGYRSPSIKELYLDFTPSFFTPIGFKTVMLRGNENLKIESSNSINAHYTYRKNLNNGNSITIEPSIIYNEIKDLIGLSQEAIVGSPLDLTTERHYINLNKVQLLNTSINIKYSSRENLNINLGISYLGRAIEYSDIFDSNGFMFTPSVNTSVSYNIKSLDLNINAFYKYSGKRKGHYIEKVAGQDVLKKSTREDFNNLDISVSKSFFNKKLDLSIGAKNIFNITDIETTNQIGEAHERNIQLWGNSFFVKTIIKI